MHIDRGIALKENYSIAEKINEVEEKFNDQIKISYTTENTSELWKDVINTHLLSIEAESQNQFYLSEVLLLNFGDENELFILKEKKDFWWRTMVRK